MISMKYHLLYLLISVMISPAMHAQVKIIAHRGASYMAPENTIASAKLAWKYKADAVECDIWLSKDSMIICSHDASTKRTTGQDLKISETNSDILRTLDAGSYKEEKYRGEKLPFLYEMIRTVPKGKELVIEIKCGTEVLPLLKNTVNKYGKGRIITFICFDLNTIKETKKIFPASSCYWLCSSAEQLKTGLSAVSDSGIEGISLHYSIINEDIIYQAKARNLEVYSWTVDDPEEARRLTALGVKGITTNRPGLLREQNF